MPKNDKIIELKLRKIELNLQKKNDVHRLAISVGIAIISLLITSGALSNIFREAIKTWVESAIRLPGAWPAIIILSLLLVLPLLAGFISWLVLFAVFKSKEYAYNQAIRDLDELITKLNKKK